MPAAQMPGATALEAAVPNEPMPAGAMMVGVKTLTKGDQGMMDIHAGLQYLAHLGQTEMQDLSTDISVGTTTTTTATTPAVSGTTGTTR